MFANTINELGSHTNLSANECERFGMTWGCSIECPVFERGECKDCFYENLESFIIDGQILSTDDEIFTLYKNKLSNEEIQELNKLLGE